MIQNNLVQVLRVDRVVAAGHGPPEEVFFHGSLERGAQHPAEVRDAAPVSLEVARVVVGAQFSEPIGQGLAALLGCLTLPRQACAHMSDPATMPADVLEMRRDAAVRLTAHLVHERQLVREDDHLAVARKLAQGTRDMATSLLVDRADRVIKDDRVRLAEHVHLREKHREGQTTLLTLAENAAQRHIRDRLETQREHRLPFDGLRLHGDLEPLEIERLKMAVQRAL
jgi:hypothetical protein